MMVGFWLATFELKTPSAPVDSPAAPILAAGSRYLAIEVLTGPAAPPDAAGPGGELRYEYAVLFSTVNDLQRPTDLKCRIGFANGAKACSLWHDRGFPLVDAKIVREATGTIRVFSPYFAKTPSPHPDSLQYESQLFALTGVPLEPEQGAPEEIEARYQQELSAPDGAEPDTLITRRAVTWTPERQDTYRLQQRPLQLELAASRWPSLAPLESGELWPVRAWSGTADLPREHRGPALLPAKRADTLGPPAFRFERVEVLGFRVDLGVYGRDFTAELDRLIEALNFPGEGAIRGAIRDFRYRAATSTLLIELLRYGKMKQMFPSPPLDDRDYQSQHELVVRLLVGRVDDDTAQARGPAVYVPAIFVDNPWSKVLGRDMQGFDKRMANFCVRGDDGTPARLLPDGRVAPDTAGPGDEGRTARELGDISLVRLVDKTGRLEGPDLLELRCSPLSYPDWNAFEAIDLDLAFGSLSVSGTRWRQSDFDDVQFRRSFARSAVTDSLRGFRSIQVSPVAKSGFPHTWITGTFTVGDDLRIVCPSGVASFTIHALPSDPARPSAPAAPKPWNMLCQILGDGRRADISLPTGSWYRLLFSMDLTIDDGLAWGGPGS